MAQELDPDVQNKVETFIKDELAEVSKISAYRLGYNLMAENESDEKGKGLIDEKNEDILIARMNADPDGAIDAIRQAVHANPKLLDELASDPNKLVAVIGAQQTPYEPATVVASAVEPEESKPEPQQEQHGRNHAHTRVTEEPAADSTPSALKTVAGVAATESAAPVAPVQAQAGAPMTNEQLAGELMGIMDSPEGTQFIGVVANDDVLRETLGNITGIDFDKLTVEDSTGAINPQEIVSAIQGMEKDKREMLEGFVHEAKEDPEYLGRLAKSMENMSPQTKGSALRLSENGHDGMAMMLMAMPAQDIGLGDTSSLMSGLAEFMAPFMEMIAEFMDKVLPGVMNGLKGMMGVETYGQSKEVVSVSNNGGKLTREGLNATGNNNQAKIRDYDPKTGEPTTNVPATQPGQAPGMNQSAELSQENRPQEPSLTMTT